AGNAASDGERGAGRDGLGKDTGQFALNAAVVLGIALRSGREQDDREGRAIHEGQILENLVADGGGGGGGVGIDQRNLTGHSDALSDVADFERYVLRRALGGAHLDMRRRGALEPGGSHDNLVLGRRQRRRGEVAGRSAGGVDGGVIGGVANRDPRAGNRGAARVRDQAGDGSCAGLRQRGRGE